MKRIKYLPQFLAMLLMSVASYADVLPSWSTTSLNAQPNAIVFSAAAPGTTNSNATSNSTPVVPQSAEAAQNQQALATLVNTANSSFVQQYSIGANSPQPNNASGINNVVIGS